MANNNDKKKYNKMEVVLQTINKKFVTVSSEDAKVANPLLLHVINTIIENMKQVNPLFKKMFESVLYGGSYYDGLKVGKPEEFDIDLKLVLPSLAIPKLCLSNQPGFVTVQMTGWANFEKSNEFVKYKGLEAFKDDKNYLLVSEVLKWIESVVNLAMNRFGKNGSKFVIPYNGKNAEISLKKSGPAMTALITCGDIYMDVDLVLVFKLTADMWPPSPFRPLPKECSEKKEFLIVPKTPKAHVDIKERCWRMSFQEQEKILILGNNTCKPALRLIKKLRDTQNHNKISSYFIKTVFLHEIEKQDKSFWNSSLSFIFMHMLKTYRDYLSNYSIPYYWNKKNNLLQHIEHITIDNFKNFLSRVIDSVDKKLEENPYIIGDHLCTSTEIEKLKQVSFVFGKSKSNGQNDLMEKLNQMKVVVPDGKSNGQIDFIEKLKQMKVVVPDSISNGQNNIQTLCIPGKSNLNIFPPQLSSSSIDDVDGPTTKEKTKENNSETIDILNKIQANLDQLNSNVKLALIKISVLETSVQDLKNDNEIFKNILRNFKTDQTVSTEIEKPAENSCDIDKLVEKIDLLQKSVQDLKTENDTLKTGLRQFVLD